MSRAPSKVHPSSKAPSQRQLRVAEEIRYALAMTMERGDVHDPILAQTPVTFTEVRVSPDLKNATAFVTPLGGGDPAEVLVALKRATPFLRHELARKITMKYVPKLSFQPDTSFDEYQHIDQLLHSPDVLRDIQGEDVRRFADTVEDDDAYDDEDEDDLDEDESGDGRKD